MDPEQRSKYVEYIAAGLRYAQKETGLLWPEETIIVTKSYGELSGTDKIMDYPVYVMDMPSPFEFWIAFPSGQEKEYRLQKAFAEYLDIYNIDDF